MYTFPKLYCLPKVFKLDIPLRPIVSSINSTTYSLSKHIADILKKGFEDRTSYNINDTFTFINAVRRRHLPDNYRVISLELISLFTNNFDSAPTNLKRNWHLLSKYTSLLLVIFYSTIITLALKVNSISKFFNSNGIPN